MPDIDLCFTPATELVGLVRARELSPVEVVENSLERIDEVNGTLNCFCFVYPDEAIEAARAAERAVSAGSPLGPLHGVPIAIKDLTPTTGKRTTMGSYAFEHHVPDESALLVDTLLGAGAIMVGKTTTPEFAYSSFTRSPAVGRHAQSVEPRAVAGRIVRRLGGRCRVGLRAARRGHRHGRLGADSGLLVRGRRPEAELRADPARLPADAVRHDPPLRAARAHDRRRPALPRRRAGPDDRDIMSLAPALDLSGRSTDRSRACVSRSTSTSGCYAVDPEVEARCAPPRPRWPTPARSSRRSTSAGRAICADAWVAALGRLPRGDLRRRARRVPRPHGPERRLADGRRPGDERGRLQAARVRPHRRLEAARADPRAVRRAALPDDGHPRPPVDEDDVEWYAATTDGRYHGLDMTALFNYTSQCPALSVPAGFTDDDLPVGLQIVARRYRDDVALGSARARARPPLGSPPPAAVRSTPRVQFVLRDLTLDGSLEVLCARCYRPRASSNLK